MEVKHHLEVEDMLEDISEEMVTTALGVQTQEKVVHKLLEEHMVYVVIITLAVLLEHLVKEAAYIVVMNLTVMKTIKQVEAAASTEEVVQDIQVEVEEVVTSLLHY